MAGDEYQIMKIESETALHVMLRVAPVSSYGRGGSHWEEILISLNFTQFKNNFTSFFLSFCYCNEFICMQGMGGLEYNNTKFKLAKLKISLTDEFIFAF